MITKNKTKDVFLTKKQLKDRDTAGTLEEGVIYNTTDEPAGHALKNVDGTLQLLDVDNNVISEATLPPECDTAELDIKHNVDGTLTDEQVTYLQSFKNLMFLKIPNQANTLNEFILYRAIKLFNNSTKALVGYTFMCLPAPLQTIGGVISELTISFATKRYLWNVRSVSSYLLSDVKYNVSGTLTASQLSNIKIVLSGRSSGWLMHITINGGDSGQNYLIYTSSEIITNTSISFICEGYKKMVLDLTTGAYTFEETGTDVTAQKIFNLTEDSDTVVREIDPKTGKVNIHLATTVNNKVNNALQMPTTQPTELLIVGLSTSKAQTNIPLGSSLKLENGHLETTIKIVRKTQSEYDNLTSYDANTMYVIVG